MIVLSSVIFPQNVDSLDRSKLFPFIVDSIKISGNETTEEFIILGELNFGTGDTLTQANSYFNRERVYSLGIFNRVYFIPAVIDGKRILNIEVEESWYIYPIPYLELKENDFSKLSYGMYLRLKNFRGRNEDLTALIALGYDPTVFLRYYNPNIAGRENIYFSSTLGYSDFSNKSPTAEKLYGQLFSQKYIYMRLLVGKRFDLFNRLYLVGGFSYIETPFFIPGINASDDRIDNVVELGVGFEHNTRDLSQFPTNGIFTSVNYTLKGLGFDNINYSVARVDYREYRKVLGGLISKWRFTSRFTFGENVPYYDYSILGVDEKIRGHYSKKYEGNDYYFGSVELIYPIIEELNIDLTFIPIIPDQLLSYRVGFYTQIFAETGIAKLKNE
ncbi:MAG: BamA/TamA family outer membrane protein, partial [Ignavibacteria bacterium]|nr:BamA/TamA family outer membrane protein [Ignavibacteria bacterium]